MLIQLVGSFTFVYIYDRSGRDIFNIPRAKAKFEVKWNWKDEEHHRSLVGKVLIFLFYTWKFMPPMVLLLMRKDSRKGNALVEIVILLFGIAGATMYSALISLGVFSLPKLWSYVQTTVFAMIT